MLTNTFKCTIIGTRIHHQQNNSINGKSHENKQSEQIVKHGYQDRRQFIFSNCVEKWIYGKHSGICESHMPCALKAQPLESCAGGASLYVLKREKLIRHTSPSRGGSFLPSPKVSGMSPAHGQASSTVQPRSRSLLSFTVPSIHTAL